MLPPPGETSATPVHAPCSGVRGGRHDNTNPAPRAPGSGVTGVQGSCCQEPNRAHGALFTSICGFDPKLLAPRLAYKYRDNERGVLPCPWRYGMLALQGRSDRVTSRGCLVFKYVCPLRP